MKRKRLLPKVRVFACQKCADRDIHVAYRVKGERLDQCIGDPYDTATTDLLRCHCRRCGYDWNEMPSGSRR